MNLVSLVTSVVNCDISHNSAPRLTLLTRAYCHLCDEMIAALAPLASAHEAQVVLVDVDTRPELESEWGEAVPVLFAGEPDRANELCRHRLDPIRVRLALDGRETGSGFARGTEIR